MVYQSGNPEYFAALGSNQQSQGESQLGNRARPFKTGGNTSTADVYSR
jgi:hypothetical protein